MRPLLMIVLSAGMSAQSLQILPSPPSGTNTSFRIMLASPSDKAPLALQWDMLLADGVTFEKIATGSAAGSAQKTITCSTIPVMSKDVAIRYRCVLAGGLGPIPDGPVAVVTYKLPEEAPEAVIRVAKTIGVSPDGRQLNLADVEATLRRK